MGNYFTFDARLEHVKLDVTWKSIHMQNIQLTRELSKLTYAVCDVNNSGF